MGILDYLILAALAALLILAVRHIRRHGACGGDCARCGRGRCGKRPPGEGPKG